MDDSLCGLCAKGGKWRKIANSFIVKMKIDRHGQGHPNDEDDAILPLLTPPYYSIVVVFEHCVLREEADEQVSSSRCY